MTAASSAVAELEPTAPSRLPTTSRAPKPATTPSTMLAQAIATGAPLDVVDRLMALIERTQANEARMAFDEALSDAKGKIPVIIKNRHVGFTSRKPGAAATDYAHEDFAEIARTVDPILAAHGLSYRYRTKQDGGTVRVTCILAHRGGHSEETELSAGHDNSGNKNSIQAIGSTITYLQRYTLKAALGLASSSDDDGAKSEETIDDVLTDKQIMDLNDLIEAAIEEVGGAAPKVFRPNLFKYLKVEGLNDLRADEYQRAVDAINSARPKK